MLKATDRIDKYKKSRAGASFTWQGLGITVLDSCWLILNFSIIDNNFLNGVHREIQIQKYLEDFLWA